MGKVYYKVLLLIDGLWKENKFLYPLIERVHMKSGIRPPYCQYRFVTSQFISTKYHMVHSASDSDLDTQIYITIASKSTNIRCELYS